LIHIVEYLIGNYQNMVTPLLKAIKLGHVDVAVALLVRGADPTLVDEVKVLG
jgi:hypothetical protein